MSNGGDRLSTKDLYAEAGTNYRYFLGWRHALFGGYIAVLGALGVALSWVLQHELVLLPAVWICTSVVSITFWSLDCRNRDLYHACQDAGERIECLQAGERAAIGVYSELATRKGDAEETSEARFKRSSLTHSDTINLLTWSVVVVSLLLFIFTACEYW